MIKLIQQGRGKTVLALALALALGVVFLTVTNITNSISAQTSDEKAVRDVLTRDAEAVEKGDISALDKLWANDESVIVFEGGGANYGWNDYRNHHLVPELKEFKNTKYGFTGVKVKVDGKTAWATFKYNLATEMGTRKIESGGVATAILEKRNGRWLIVHWHSSSPRRQSPSPTPKS